MAILRIRRPTANGARAAFRRTQHLHLTLPENRQGCDYFVGDIHGAQDKLRAELDSIGFDYRNDRLIGVGDTLDRGEGSRHIWQLLEEPWFHSVRGNHENLFLRWMKIQQAESAGLRGNVFSMYYRALSCGGRWTENAEPADLLRIQRQVRKLPYSMTVEQPGGQRIGVIHAEVPDGCAWGDVTDGTVDRMKMTWGRQRIRGKAHDDRHRIAGVDALVVGHTVVPSPTIMGNIVYLDCGGWMDRPFAVVPAERVLAGVSGS